MQGIIEELESSNEELTASNEEIVSMNEELQSANEELETSKEELQSLNEELRTVNNELQEKVEQLEHATNDLENLLRSTNIPTIFLDEKLRLKRFTPSATSLFSILPTDRGRPISDLSLRMQDMTLIEDAEAVLASLQSVSKKVHSPDGRSYIHRTQPYRTTENAIRGVVMTFVDITDVEQAQEELQRHREHLEELVEKRTEELEVNQQRLRGLAAELVEAEQRERQRLATVLHDEVAQPLGAIKLRLSLLRQTLPEAADDIAQVIGIADEATVQARDVMSDLSPPVLERLGLAEALRWWAERTNDRYQVQVQVEAPPERLNLPLVTAIAAFQAARELVHNAIKHSGVKEVAVALRCLPEALELEVRDGGKGFDPEAVVHGEHGGYGLYSIRERLQYLGGGMNIQSSPGTGTTIVLRLPGTCATIETANEPPGGDVSYSGRRGEARGGGQR